MPDTHAHLGVTLETIRAAAERLRGHILRTPTLYSDNLSRSLGIDIWIKYENQHVTGAFKERGALNRLLALDENEKQRGVIAASAGNHAQALARHGALLGVPTTIVMPNGTPNVKVEQTRARGAQVVLQGDTFDDSYAHAQKLCDERNLVFVPPFDDAQIIAGQGTAALEMLEDAPEIDTLVAPIGGGGLIAGMAVAAKGLKPAIRIVGVEAAMYP